MRSDLGKNSFAKLGLTGYDGCYALILVCRMRAVLKND
jgi:hypothetical protein